MTQPVSSSSSNFALTIAVVVAVCGGIAVLGLRDRRQAEAAGEVSPLAGEAPRPTLYAPAPEQAAPTEAPAPTLLDDPTAEPKATFRGKITFDENRQMIVTDEESDKELTLTPEQLESRVVRFHRDDQAKAYWLDLNDGTRVELDPSTAKTMEETLPRRFTYGAQRADDAPPEMLGSDTPNPR